MDASGWRYVYATPDPIERCAFCRTPLATHPTAMCVPGESPRVVPFVTISAGRPRTLLDELTDALAELAPPPPRNRAERRATRGRR